MFLDDNVKIDQSESKPETSQPLANPLGNLSSYTYGVSLYMISTEVMNRFISAGGTMAGINGNDPGVRVVAQSGGMSATDRTLDGVDNVPAPEYYIDDLNITTFLPGGPQKASVSAEIKFKIYEPYGFTFIQNLTRSGMELNKESKVNAPYMNGIQQHFIIGIKFYGYDVNGNVITQLPANSKGGETGPLPERYFSIRVTRLKFKLDGKMVVYNCEAVVVSESVANGQVNGILKTATTLSGSTVWEVLGNEKNKSSLVSILNSNAQSNKDTNKVTKPTTYSIEFLDEDGNVLNAESVIGKSKLVNDAVFDNTLASTFNASSSEKSTIANQFKAVSIDGNKVSLPQTGGQTLLTIIDNIITKSQYVTKSLKQFNTATADTKTKTQSPQELEWYSINPVIQSKGFDEKTNDWAYHIKFQIKPYKTPYVRTVMTSVVSTYGGPSKRYEYWLTGLNSEIIKYEQEYNSLFYVATLASQTPAPPEEKNKTGSAPVKVENQSGGNSSGSRNRQFDFNQTLAAQMYSPGDQAMIRMQIMGDPDFIMSASGVNATNSLGNNKVGIDPLKGQVFIEIKFLMATDYDGSTGLLNVSNNIQLYNPEAAKELKIDGVVYKIYKVSSTFSKGRFVQDLEGVLADQAMISTSIEKSNSNNSNYSNEGRNNQSAKRDPNVTKETLDRSGVPRNMVGRQGGNDAGKPYVDARSTAITPSTVLSNDKSKYQKPITLNGSKSWSILENQGVPSTDIGYKNDDQVVKAKPQIPTESQRTKPVTGTRGGQ